MKVITTEESYILDIYDMMHLFMQGEEQNENKPYIYFDMQKNGSSLFLNFKIEFDAKNIENKTFVVIKNYKNSLEEKRYIKGAIKKFLYEILSSHFNRKLPWGALTGIRPTKVAYDLIDSGIDRFFIKETLQNEFYVSEDKAKLVDKIIKNQTSIIKNDKLVDLYINIPFCPSKCSYCSFISAEYSKVENIIPNYIQALKKEIKAVKKIIVDNVYIVRSIYIGGGTPTVLSSEDLENVLSELSFDVVEFTVECGRPDTITKEKLDVLKKYGVTRISINPQTFVDATLKRIGRKHTTKDIIEAYKLALPYDFSINMDLIAGLPGESLRGFKKTINTVLNLYPDNITIHTLALKKGSQLAQENVKNENDTTQKMVSFGQDMLMENNYKPYYMYKLKNQNAGLENVGFFREKFCIFNIDSMEETASILACGANAISKRVYSIENRIERQANVKFATDYIQRIDELIEKKTELFSK